MNYLEKTAELSDDGRYRYTLTRRWGEGEFLPMCTFIGLNPSYADADVDDATIRKCVGFADRWGFKQITMLNLFAYRATDPEDMKQAPDPIGPDNDIVLAGGCASSIMTVACWGNHGTYLERDVHVRGMLTVDLVCLGTTLQSQPCHPGRIAYATPLQAYYPRRVTP